MAKQSLNIYMVVWKFFPCIEGGAERQCRKLTVELSKQGYSCAVLTSCRDKGLQFREIMPEGYTVQRLGEFAWIEAAFKRRFRWIRARVSWSKFDQIDDAVNFWTASPFVWISRLSFMFSLRRFLKTNSYKIDVLHVHEAHWIAGAVAWAAQGLNIPIVCKEADHPAVKTISYDTPLRSILAGYRNQVHYIAMTTAISESLQDNGIAQKQITIIPNGVHIPTGRSQVIGERDIVYIGNFTQGVRRKAFDILFESWVLAQQTIQNKNRLVVLGAGNPDTWKKYLTQHDCLDSVYFAGSVGDVSQYLRKARLFLLPSRIEGLSNALLEAMSWGVPVIVSDIKANCSLVRHQQNGWVVPVNDSKALSKSIIDLVADDALSLKLGTSGRNIIKKEFSIQHVVSSLLTLYKQLIENNKDRVA
jgi:glycosyltransferase involved in cell wall biosynthesis